MLRTAGISVVIPVYNERTTIEEILMRVQAVAPEKEIVVVDDGSTDGTREFLSELAAHAEGNPGTLTVPGSGRTLRADNIRVFFQDKNRGKGAALRRGFHEAHGDIIIIQDADLEYDPADYAALVAPIDQGRAEVVFGSRFLGGPHRVLFFWHSVGNWLLTTVSNMFTNLNLTDVWTCYKVLKREVLDKIELKEDRFGFEAEITAKVAKQRCRIYEVPISYHGRTYAQGKKITWKDGVRGIWSTIRYNVFP
ncbi:MAG TPA: glycosyltransferase family 2 protein [Terriglobia bacterium]|nr:glycosyltransferase family 2 protein [Terriglobia bacterium]